MSPNKELEPRVELPFPAPPGIFGPTIPGTTRLRVRDPESDSNERLVEVETERIGSDSNWVQLGPTSNPRDFEAPYARDVDGDGHTDFGLQVNITPDFYGTVPYVSGAVTGAAIGSAFPGPGTIIGAAVGTGVGHIGATTLNRLNAHYAIGFNIEPGSVIEGIQETAGEVWEEISKNPVPNPSPIPNPLDPFIPDPLEPFVPNPLDPLISGPWEQVQDGIRSGVGQALGMPRLDAAFARLQSLL